MVFLVEETVDFGRDLEGGVLRGEGLWGGGGRGAEGFEIFDGEDLLIEDEAELAGCLVGQGFEGWN